MGPTKKMAGLRILYLEHKQNDFQVMSSERDKVTQ
jgi:hypothetical protein